MNKSAVRLLSFILASGIGTIAAGQNLPDTTIMIPEVKVSAYRVTGNVHTSPGSISVLSGPDLDISDGQNFSTVINTIPGVSMQSGTLTTNRIVIRGMGSRTPYNSNRIRAYLNDIPVTSADGVSTPEELNIQGMEKIEVLKGPSSALYGSGLGGSINMYTPVNAKKQGTAGVQYGSFYTGKVHMSGTAVKDKFISWGNFSHTGSEGYRENNNFRRTTFLTTTRWEHAAWSLNTTFLVIGSKGGIPSSVGYSMFKNSPWQAAPGWLAIGGFKNYYKILGAINLKNNFGSRLSGDGIIFGRWNDNYEKRPFNNLDDWSSGSGFRYNLSFRAQKAEFVTGTEIITEEYGWSLDQNNNLINENSERRWHFNVFSMIQYKPLAELNFSLAGAVNRISYRLNDLYPANGDQSGARKFPFIFSPRLGINYSPGGQLAIYASAGHGFSLPSPEETLLPAGDVNPGIKPEQGMQYETGIRLKPASVRVEVDASFYLITLKNLLVTKRVTEDIFTGINAGRTRHHGVELQMKAVLSDAGTFPGKLSSALSYTVSINRFVSFTDNDIVHDGKFLPGIPLHSLQVQFFWNVFRIFELHSHLQYIGRQYLTDDNTREYPGYFLANFKLSTTLKTGKNQEIMLYTGVNNITDTHYASMLVVNAQGFGDNEPRYYYPGLPVNWYGGVRYSF